MMNDVRPNISLPIASCTSRSDSESCADVASSRIRMRGLRRIARAIATRCLCPTDNRTPRSPTSVSYAFGSATMNSCAFAAFAASTISSSLAPSRPKPMFSLTVVPNRNVSCGTSAIFDLSEASVTECTSVSSISTRPSVTSYRRGISETRVVFPAPLGPTSAIISPGRASRSIPASTSDASSPYRKLTPSSRTRPFTSPSSPAPLSSTSVASSRNSKILSAAPTAPATCVYRFANMFAGPNSMASTFRNISRFPGDISSGFRT